MLAVGMLAQVSGTVAANAAVALIPFLTRDRGLTLGHAGALASASLLGTTVSLVGWGVVVDRWGERLTLTLGLVVTTVGSAAAAFAVVAAEVWRGTGVTAVILLVGLTRVDRRLIDSAVADGATSWQRLLRVTWPAAAPAVAVAVLYRATDALRALEGPLLAAPSGGVRTVPVLTWETTFESFERGLGAASGVLLLVLTGLVAAVLVAVLRPGRRA